MLFRFEQQGKDVAAGENYSVSNCLISFVVVCNRLQMEINCYIWLTVSFLFFQTNMDGTQPQP